MSRAAGLAFAANLVTIGYYLGSDGLVNHIGWYFIASSDDSIAQRSRKLRFLLLCDQQPRMALILFVATGFSYEILAGVSPVPAAYLLAIWAICLLWMVNIWLGFLGGSRAWARRLVDIDVAWRGLLGAVFLGCGAWSLVAAPGFAPAWMALKYALLGALILAGVSVRFLIRALTAAWPRFLIEGSTPRFEAIVRNCLVAASCVVYVLWIVFLVMGWLTVKSFLILSFNE
jgi:hypothetical protein